MTVKRTLPSACSSVVLVWVAAALAVACSQSSESRVAADEGRDPRVALPSGYAPESACQECHSAEHEAHAASHHARAMAVATPASVRGRFDDSVFSKSGISARFFARDGRYYVHTQGPQGALGDFEVRYTFGYEPLQQVLLALAGGRLQAFDVAWDTTRERWFWLGEGEAPEPGATLHWAGPFYRWNRACAECHSTAVRKGFDPASGAYSTTYAATSVGCQACHGPGAAHVRWAEGDVDRPDTGVLRGDGTTECLPCHSHRVTLAEGWRPGDELLDFFSPSLLRGDLYFPDGQIREEVFEYGSFLQSRMARAGVACVDCHDAHRGSPREEGNALCIRCHGGTSPARFAGRVPPGDFAARTHTRHSPESPGAQCASCHMPQHTYMKVDPRRDHGFTVPRPDLSLRYGTPNACTGCHDRDDTWAAATMDRWYGARWRARPSPAHAFAAARASRASAAGDLVQWVENRDAPAIVRGTALVELAALDAGAAYAHVRSTARSRDPLLRLASAEASARLHASVRLEAAGALLGDELRAVRLAALRSLAGVAASGEAIAPAQRTALDRARRDLESFLAANADVAEAHTTYGSVRLDEGRFDEAEAAFRRAVELDPGFAGGYVNLAEVLRVSGHESEALRVFSDAIERIPGSAELHYGQGLAWVRARRLPDAAEAFARARRLAPGDSHYALAYVLALESLGRIDRALHEAEALARLRPEDPVVSTLLRRLREQVDR